MTGYVDVPRALDPGHSFPLQIYGIVECNLPLLKLPRTGVLTKKVNGFCCSNSGFIDFNVQTDSRAYVVGKLHRLNH